MLINRVANTDMTWHQEVTNAAPRVSPIVDLTLDDAPVVRAVDNLNFIQMKRKYICAASQLIASNDTARFKSAISLIILQLNAVA